MAFDIEESKELIEGALGNAPASHKKKEPENENLTDSIGIEQVKIPVSESDENTKNYTFSLQPKVRKKLNSLAQEYNYKSASRFLNDLIKNLN